MLLCDECTHEVWNHFYFATCKGNWQIDFTVAFPKGRTSSTISWSQWSDCHGFWSNVLLRGVGGPQNKMWYTCCGWRWNDFIRELSALFALCRVNKKTCGAQHRETRPVPALYKDTATVSLLFVTCPSSAVKTDVQIKYARERSKCFHHKKHRFSSSG